MTKILSQMLAEEIKANTMLKKGNHNRKRTT